MPTCVTQATYSVATSARTVDWTTLVAVLPAAATSSSASSAGGMHCSTVAGCVCMLRAVASV